MYPTLEENCSPAGNSKRALNSKRIRHFESEFQLFMERTGRIFYNFLCENRPKTRNCRKKNHYYMLNGVRRNKKSHISKPFTPPSCDAKSLLLFFFFLFHIFILAHCAISYTINPILSIQQICRIYKITQIIHGYCHYGTNGK